MYYLQYASRIKGKIRIQIDREKCTDCGYCFRICKEKVFIVNDRQVLVGNPSSCNGCRKCVDTCVYNAIYISVESDQEEADA